MSERFHRLKENPSAVPLAMSAAVVLLVVVFAQLASEMLEGELQRFDTAVAALFRASGNITTPIGPAWLQEAARDVTALGSFSCLGILFGATMGYLLLLGRRRVALFVAASLLGGAALSTGLKLGFDRPRPEAQHATRVFTASFPSGHAMLSAVTFLTLGALLSRLEDRTRVKVYFMSVAVLLTLIVGTSRVYLGVHYGSDVVGGWCMGAAWALLCWTVALYLQRRGQLPPPAHHPDPGSRG